MMTLIASVLKVKSSRDEKAGFGVLRDSSLMTWSSLSWNIYGIHKSMRNSLSLISWVLLSWDLRYDISSIKLFTQYEITIRWNFNSNTKQQWPLQLCLKMSQKHSEFWKKSPIKSTKIRSFIASSWGKRFQVKSPIKCSFASLSLQECTKNWD